MSAALLHSRAAHHEGVRVSFASPVRRLLAAHWALPAVCALFLFAGALTVDDYSPWVDTWGQRAIGNAALDYLAGDGERAFEQLHRSWDRYYGAVFEAPLVLAERILGLEHERDVYLARHLLTHLFFLAGGVFCYLLVRRLFNSRLLALVAMALFLLHPRIYAHSFFNSKDIPFLATFMIALYLTHRAFRRDTLGAFLLCGAGVGLLVNLRVMGVVLFAAVLVPRALDLAFAGNAEERRRVLLTGGGFAVVSLLTFYASLPVLWTDPAGQFGEWARTLGAHQPPWFHLFRGEWLYSASGPPWDYVPVWVGITTPPATLLLAMAGAVALALRAIRRPRNVFRDGPLRFGLLLAALPAATTAAVVVLENNIYHDWRHLYFLYAPLLLLAVFGLHGVMVLARGRWPRAGAYALTGAAVAVTVVSMVRVHPYEDNHFTVLTDRTTPGHPASRYEMEYWGQYIRPAVILKDHPPGRVFISPSSSFARLQLRALPPDERERIMATKDFRSGERNFLELHQSQPCLAPRAAVAYAARIYAATLHCVVDPVVWLGGLRRQARAMEPLVRSIYDIHRDGRLLTYVRDGCPRNDVAGGSGGTRFFLHVVPLDASDLPERGLGFDNLDGALRDGTARIDGNCVAAVVLPDYPIATIRTGQITDSGVIWEVEFTPDGRGAVPPPPDYAAARRQALAQEPLARSIYDVHLNGRTLTYVRDGCTDADARFFLHVYPANEGDLPEHRREHGFDNLDFTLAAHGARIDGDCVAVARLPDYPIATVRTGQYDETGALWTAEFAPADGE